MADPIILYSTNTWIAYQIARRYYRDNHFVWCTPYWDSRALPGYDVVVPPTSTPLDIYKQLYREVQAGDRHSAKIKENKLGILRGAVVKKGEGIITPDQESDINVIVEHAETRDFKPLLYVIPFILVGGLVREVPVQQRAHPLSSEFMIESLPTDYFHVIEFEA